MRKILFALLTAMIAVTADAQFVSFPRFGKNLKMCSDPILGMEGLHVGDEGYVTFEHSVQVLAARKAKIKPGRTYSITTVFPTDRLNPYARYFVGFEYNENGHTVPMGFTEAKPLESFMLLPAIINSTARKAPVKAKIKEIKKSSK